VLVHVRLPEVIPPIANMYEFTVQKSTGKPYKNGKPGRPVTKFTGLVVFAVT
jgi:hypothetical protein